MDIKADKGTNANSVSMNKQERVIKWLESCISCALFKRHCATDCPYYDIKSLSISCAYIARKEAIALLKRQEPKLVVDIHRAFNNLTNPHVPWVGKCPKCGKKIEGKNLTHFCKYCGQAVKWE